MFKYVNESFYVYRNPIDRDIAAGTSLFMEAGDDVDSNGNQLSPTEFLVLGEEIMCTLCMCAF